MVTVVHLQPDGCQFTNQSSDYNIDLIAVLASSKVFFLASDVKLYVFCLQVIDFNQVTSMYGSVHCASQVVRRLPRRFVQEQSSRENGHGI